MPLPYIVDSIDTIPESVRAYYAEHEGRFRLNIDGGDFDVAGLKSALQKERETVKAHRIEIATWKKLGKSPDEIAALIEAPQNAAVIIEQHATAWKTEKAGLESDLNAARASERAAIIDATLAAALEKAKVTNEGFDLLSSRLSARIMLETVDGKRVVRILAADGKTPMRGSGPEGVATFADLINESMRAFPSLFEGTGAGGGGKPPNHTRPYDDKILTRAEFNALPYAERAVKSRTHKIID